MQKKPSKPKSKCLYRVFGWIPENCLSINEYVLAVSENQAKLIVSKQIKKRYPHIVIYTGGLSLEKIVNPKKQEFLKKLK